MNGFCGQGGAPIEEFVAMKAEDLAQWQRAQMEEIHQSNERKKRGEPVMLFTAHLPMKVDVSQTGSAVVEFLYARERDGTGLFAQMTLTAEATQTLRAKLLESKNIPDGLPAIPDPKRAN